MRIRTVFVISVLFVLFGCQSRGDKAIGTELGLTWLSNWDKAVEVSKGQNKNMLVEFSTEWCPYCKYVEENVFNKDDVAKRLSEYVLLAINGDKKDVQALMDKLEVQGFPTFIIFGPSGKELVRFNDVGSNADFIAILDRLDPKKMKVDDKEEKLASTLDKISDDKLKTIATATKLISEYPDSFSLPFYYDKLADAYSSDALKKMAMNKVASIVKGNLVNFDKLNDSQKWKVIDEQIDLASNNLKKLNRFSERNEMLIDAAARCEDMIEAKGGIKSNLYIIGTVVDLYSSAGANDRAEKFLKKATKEAPNYWPVYTNMAKVLMTKGETSDAIPLVQKAYVLADEVAKPRVAIVLAEAYVVNGNIKRAVEVLKLAKDELEKGSNASFGRAAKMLKALDERIGEYRAVSTFPNMFE